MHGVALAVSGLWAGWWIFFSVASSMGEIAHGQPFSIVPVVIVLFLAGGMVVAWRRPIVGGPLFVAFGLFLLWACVYFFHNTRAVTWFLVTTLSIPPFVAGVILMAAALRRSRNNL